VPATAGTAGRYIGPPDIRSDGGAPALQYPAQNFVTDGLAATGYQIPKAARTVTIMVTTSNAARASIAMAFPQFPQTFTRRAVPGRAFLTRDQDRRPAVIWV
jgi:hypothetical protein